MISIIHASMCEMYEETDNLSLFSNVHRFDLIIYVQVQIQYRRKDGSKWLRVISQSREISRNREEVERASNMAVVGLSTVHRSAKLAQEGRVKEARQTL